MNNVFVIWIGKNLLFIVKIIKRILKLQEKIIFMDYFARFVKKEMMMKKLFYVIFVMKEVIFIV